jgi:chromatin remodeling complex protein RSC6
VCVSVPTPPGLDHYDDYTQEERVTMAVPKKSATKSADGESGKSNAAAQSQKKGLMTPMQPDEDLAAIVGHEPLPRTEITKRVWDYIKEHQLQDPANKRLINADERLQRVLDGKRKVTMFEMTRLVNKHVKRANE